MGRWCLVAVVLAAALTCAWVPTAGAATDFFSSFEASESPPTWESTAETDANGVKRMSGVTGSSTADIPGNIREQVTAVTASERRKPSRRDRRARQRR